MTVLIAHGELGLAAQRNRAGYRSCLGINSGSVFTAAIKREYAFWKRDRK